MNFAAKAALASLIAAAPLSGAFAQAPAAPPPAALAVPNPSYATLVLEMPVNKPAAQVWAKIGKYCDIQEWFGMTCVMTLGKAGDLGSVRTLNGATIEILVAKTDLSYTYAQPVRVNTPYNVYHGTLEAKPVTATTSKLIYSMIWDQSLLADDAARAAAKASRVTRFTAGLEKMKAIAEAK
jgi:uncharacterized protein YndB with AHSA1/START domain